MAIVGIFMIFILAYLILIGWMVTGMMNLEFFQLETEDEHYQFSICIPFRNEAENLPNLLKSLAQLNYHPKNFEIIFIDDASTDNSADLVRQFSNQNLELSIQLLNNIAESSSPKKEALKLAIQQAKFNYIMTTDADCIIPENWLQQYNAFLTNYEADLVAGPVTYTSRSTLFENFQLLDFLSLQSLTIAGFGHQKPFLCNGANLCFCKKTFKEIEGYEGNTNIASGDDIFLLEKMEKHQKQTAFLANSEATVYTYPVKTLKQIFAQRVRWAAKTSKFKKAEAKFIGLIVLMANISLIILMVFCFFKPNFLVFFAILLSIKFCADFVILNKTINFYQQGISAFHYLISTIIYPFFVSIVSLFALFGGYTWKGRKFSK